MIIYYKQRLNYNYHYRKMLKLTSLLTKPYISNSKILYQNIPKRFKSSSNIPENISSSGTYYDVPRRFGPRPNRIINFLPEGNKYVIERMGKFKEIAEPGFKFVIPFFERIAYDVNFREIPMRMSKSEAISDDNVSVTFSANIWVQYHNAHDAVYKNSDPNYACMQTCASIVRAYIGTNKLDKLLGDRTLINTMVLEQMRDRIKPWGCSINNFEITDLSPTDPLVQASLHKRYTAEIDKKATIINAEANKTEMERKAEGYKIQQERMAEGDAAKVKLEASAKAEAITLITTADLARINQIIQALSQQGSSAALQYELTQEYIKAYKEMAKTSTTMIVPSNNDIYSILSIGSKILQGKSSDTINALPQIDQVQTPDTK